MAVDLSIQLFAYELFNRLLVKYGHKARPFSASTIPENVHVESHINNDIVEAVFVRQILFRESYVVQFEYTNIAQCDSPSDFLAHASLAFADESFRKLKVFDRMIATCAFVMEMSTYCYTTGNKRFYNDDFLCWAMYFDTELKSTFYKQGGWQVLKSVAKSYILPFLALDLASRSPYYVYVHLDKFMVSMSDYYYFQAFQDNGNKTYAKSWVSFRLSNRKRPGDPIFNYKTFDDIENFLTCFKYLCDPLGERILDGKFRTYNTNIASTFKANEFLENLIGKLSKLNLSYPTKQNCDFQGNREINRSQNEYLDRAIAEQAATMHFNELEIQRLSNLLKDSRDELYLSKEDVSEDQDKSLRTQDTQSCLDNDAEIDQNRRLPVQETEGYSFLNDSTYFKQNCKNIKHQTERFKVYEQMKNALNWNSIHAVLNHANVFEVDYCSTHMKEEFAPNKTCQVRVKHNSNARDENYETPQTIGAASLEGQVTQNGAKKKKKRKTKSGNVPSASTLVTTKSEVYADDTKDILRMGLVLGCQPGVNYIRSTLKGVYKSTSF